MKIRFIAGFFFVLFCLTGVISGQDQAKTPNMKGEWSITLTFVAGEAHHTAVFEQDGENLTGVYKGELTEGRLRGKVQGNTVDFTGYLQHEATGVSFHYTGTIEGDTIKGTVDMGEYWTADFVMKKGKKK